MHDIAEGASEFATKAKESAQQWASCAADMAGDAGHKAQELAGTAVDKMGDIGQDLTNLIRRHPVQALLVGFGVGFLIARAYDSCNSK